MTKTKATPCDVADYLSTPEDCAYLDACIAESQGDPAFIAKAIGDIARAKGMSELARDTGMGRESLYKALSGERNPEFGAILKVLKALGLEFRTTVTST
jgi:probable addiction module antidote protein